MSRPPAQSQPQTADVIIEKMAAGGDGLGHLPDGRVVFATGGITGETVRVSLTSNRKDFARGVVSTVLEADAHRLSPPCSAVSAGCGGCGWQHISPDYQYQLKVQIVMDALRRTAKREGDDVAFGGAVSPWAYRTSARLAVESDGRLGFRAGSAHRVVYHGACPVLHPALSGMLGDLRVEGADEEIGRASCRERV